MTNSHRHYLGSCPDRRNLFGSTVSMGLPCALWTLAMTRDKARSAQIIVRAFLRWAFHLRTKPREKYGSLFSHHEALSRRVLLPLYWIHPSPLWGKAADDEKCLALYLHLKYTATFVPQKDSHLDFLLSGCYIINFNLLNFLRPFNPCFH